MALGNQGPFFLPGAPAFPGFGKGGNHERLHDLLTILPPNRLDFTHQCGRDIRPSLQR